jgi:hypothetical protein
MMPTDTIAIMMPKSMTFKPGAASPYSAVTEDTTAQTYVARSVSPSQPLEFTVAGSGQLPRDTAAGAGDNASSGTQPGGGAAAATGSAATDTRPGGGLGNPIDPTGNDDPWAKYRWWIIGSLGLILAAGAGFMLKGGGAAAGAYDPARVLAAGVVPAPAPVAVPGGDPLLAAMKEELFVLETDRLAGTVTEAAYAEQKAALDVVLRRALARGKAATDTYNAGRDNV